MMDVALPCSTNIFAAEPDKLIRLLSKKFVFRMPEEIIIEILVLLPVKSLIRFKTVCKTWLSIISNPGFIKSQLHHATIASRKNPSITILSFEYPTVEWNLHRRRLINEVLVDMSRHYLSSSPMRLENLVIPCNFQPYIQPRKTSFNGIFCLSNDYIDSVVYLWNPSIRQYLRLPPVPDRYTTSQIIRTTNHVGFGYDSISDAYKVFRVLYAGYTNNDGLLVFVYSTNTGCWKEFQAPLLENKFFYQSSLRNDVVVNGVLYLDGGDTIISLDLHKEVFGLVPFPEFVQGKGSYVLEFEGSLAMVFDSNLWTLDDVSGEVSWTKRFSIQEADSEKRIWISYYIGAGQFLGKIFIGDEFLYNILYDCEKKETKSFVLGEGRVQETFKYIETLVSLDGFQYLD